MATKKQKKGQMDGLTERQKHIVELREKLNILMLFVYLHYIKSLPIYLIFCFLPMPCIVYGTKIQNLIKMKKGYKQLSVLFI